MKRGYVQTSVEGVAHYYGAQAPDRTVVSRLISSQSYTGVYNSGPRAQLALQKFSAIVTGVQQVT